MGIAYFLRNYLFIETESRYIALAVDQPGLELTEIQLPLPPKYWDKKQGPCPVLLESYLS